MREPALHARERIGAYVLRREFPWELCTLLGTLLISSSGTLTGISPVGSAASAAALISRRYTLPAFIGALAGAAAGGRWESAAGTAIFGLLYLLARIWRQRVGALEKFALLITSQLILFPLFYIRTLNRAMAGCAMLILTAAGAALFRQAFTALDAIRRRRMLTNAEQAGICILAGVFAFTLTPMRIEGVSLGVVFSTAAALFAAQAKGISSLAAAVALGLGAAASGDGFMVLVGLTCCTLCACALRDMGKWGTLTGFAVCYGVVYRLTGGAGVSELIASSLGMLGFAVAPSRLLRAVSSYTITREMSYSKKQLQHMKDRIGCMTAVLRQIADLFTAQGNTDDMHFTNRQLKGVCAALERLRQDEPVIRKYYDLSVGAAACPKGGSDATGDSMGIRNVYGRVLLALSDGMGTGGAAHKESTAAIALLGDLLSVGFDLDDALESVNRLLIARGEGEMYATLDAMLLDPSNASAKFIKYGAPPSYIIRNGKVHTLYAETLPLGILQEARPAVHQINLRRGDAVVLMTDGASDSLGSEIFATLLERGGGANTANDAAEAILSYAREKSDDDDMTVLFARVT